MIKRPNKPHWPQQLAQQANNNKVEIGLGKASCPPIGRGIDQHKHANDLPKQGIIGWCYGIQPENEIGKKRVQTAPKQIVNGSGVKPAAKGVELVCGLHAITI